LKDKVGDEEIGWKEQSDLVCSTGQDMIVINFYFDDLLGVPWDIFERNDMFVYVSSRHDHDR